MRLLRFGTCVDDKSNVVGAQFSLWSEENQTELTLSPIGTFDGECRTLELSGGGLDSIQASFSEET